MLHYEIHIYWDNIDRIYVASAQELPGCMAHGDTYEDAIQEIQVAMKNWIKVARELGRKVPEPKQQPVEAV